MTLQELASVLGIAEIPEAFCKFYEAGGTPVPLGDLSVIDAMESRYGMLGKYYPVIREVAQTVSALVQAKLGPTLIISAVQLHSPE